MIPDLSTRVYNHSFRIDPIVRTLLDTDFYKLLMLQMIWRLKPKTRVTFGLKNRSPAIRLADTIAESELVAQLDHARGLRFQKNELIWLAGNSFYGKARIFDSGFLDYLAAFRLPPYELCRRDGEFELRFPGLWRETTMWEIPALAVLNELRARTAMRSMSRFELDILYARAKAKLWSKVERLRVLAREGPLKLSDFGTRRRHGFLWQRWCVEALQEAMDLYGAPEIFNTDQGVQFTSASFIDELAGRGVRISMDGKGRFLDNIFIERLWRSLKYEDIVCCERVASA